MCYFKIGYEDLFTYSFLDPFPDNSGHFISIKVDDWGSHDNFGREGSLSDTSAQHFM